MVVGSRTVLAKSCNKCHELKMAKNFILTARGYRHGTCTSCRNFAASPDTKRRQKVSIRTAGQAYSKWSEDDVAYLRFMIDCDFTAEEMARRLGRTLYSIYGKCYALKKES